MDDSGATNRLAESGLDAEPVEDDRRDGGGDDELGGGDVMAPF
jgi:hypothetical protein